MKKWLESRAPAGRFAYVNGRYLRHAEAGVHVEDRGLQLGEAIYEVCSVRGGKLIDEEPHLDRLERSLATIDVPMPVGRAALKRVLRELVARLGDLPAMAMAETIRLAVLAFSGNRLSDDMAVLVVKVPAPETHPARLARPVPFRARSGSPEIAQVTI